MLLDKLNTGLWCLLLSVTKLMEVHGDGGSHKTGEIGESGERVARPDNYEPPVQQSV